MKLKSEQGQQCQAIERLKTLEICNPIRIWKDFTTKTDGEWIAVDNF